MYNVLRLTREDSVDGHCPVIATGGGRGFPLSLLKLRQDLMWLLLRWVVSGVFYFIVSLHLHTFDSLESTPISG